MTALERERENEPPNRPWSQQRRLDDASRPSLGATEAKRKGRDEFEVSMRSPTSAQPPLAILPFVAQLESYDRPRKLTQSKVSTFLSSLELKELLELGEGSERSDDLVRSWSGSAGFGGEASEVGRGDGLVLKRKSKYDDQLDVQGRRGSGRMRGRAGRAERRGRKLREERKAARGIELTSLIFPAANLVFRNSISTNPTKRR